MGQMGPHDALAGSVVSQQRPAGGAMRVPAPPGAWRQKKVPQQLCGLNVVADCGHSVAEGSFQAGQLRCHMI